MRSNKWDILSANEGANPRLALCVTIGFALLLASLAILKYFNLHSAANDLGIYTHMFFKIGAGEWWRAFVGHVEPLRLFYAWLYMLGGAGGLGVSLILGLQTIVLAIPVYWLAVRYGWIAALAYILFFALWYGALFDFHMDHVGVLLLFAFLYADDQGRYKTAAFFGVSLCLVKETFALQAITCGLYLIVMRRQYVLGGMVALCALLWSYWALGVVLPLFVEGGQSPAFSRSAYSWMGDGFGAALTHVILNLPQIVFSILQEVEKLKYLFVVFASLAFLPLLAPRYLFVAAVPFAIALLSVDPNFYGYKHHYSLQLVPPLIFAFIAGRRTAMRGLARVHASLPARFPFAVILVLLLAHGAFSPSPASRLFWGEKVWSYGKSAYFGDERPREIASVLKTLIPSDPDVSVTTQNTVFIDHLAARTGFYVFPQATPTERRVYQLEAVTLTDILWGSDDRAAARVHFQEVVSDYVVIDLKAPYYLGDRGCLWIYGVCENKDNEAAFLQHVQELDLTYDEIYKEDGLRIFKRRSHRDE